MTVLAWFTMAFVLSLVWGGFLFTLLTALRKEHQKSHTATENEQDLHHSDRSDREI